MRAGQYISLPSRHHRPRFRLSAAVAATILAIASSAAADLLTERADWQQLDVPNRPAASFNFTQLKAGRDELRVRTDKSVAFLYRSITLTQQPRMVFWRWRLDRPFAHTDLTAKGKDDRPLAVHLWFSDPDQPSVFGTLGWIFGYPHITHTLTYVLGGQHRPGSIVTNPYYDNGAVLALRGTSVRTGHWYTEMRDIKRDIEASFPSMPTMKTLKYIAISADTDDLGGTSTARLSGLRLSGVKDAQTR
jgi:hypothetical protein